MPSLPRDELKTTEGSNKDWGAYYRRTLDLPTPDKIAGFLKEIPQNGTVLDFGCGAGRYTAAMHRDRPDLHLHALDLHINEAPLLADAPWLEKKMHQSFAEFSSPNTYDGILARHALFFEPPERHQPLFQQLSDALKPGGTLDLTFVEHNAKGFPFHGRSEPELRAMLEKTGLTIDKMQREQLTYGTSKTIIPTHIIHARKKI